LVFTGSRGSGKSWLTGLSLKASVVADERPIGKPAHGRRVVELV